MKKRSKVIKKVEKEEDFYDIFAVEDISKFVKQRKKIDLTDVILILEPFALEFETAIHCLREELEKRMKKNPPTEEMWKVFEMVRKLHVGFWELHGNTLRPFVKKLGKEKKQSPKKRIEKLN